MNERTTEPTVVLYRIGRAPDPLSAPPRELQKNTGNRYDDPAGEFWVMYAAEQRSACFAETLARFRADPELLAKMRALPDGDHGDDTPEFGIIPDDWHLKRAIAPFRIVPEQRWLDLRSLEVRESIRRNLAGTITRLGHDNFDLGDALSRDRWLTHATTRWAYEQDHQRISYPSRLGGAFTRWALFEGAQFEPIETTAIAADDPDLTGIADLFRLRVAT
jgi:hypothetical protein